MTHFFREKRVVVTGGAGFLGRVVVRKLGERGCPVVVVPRRASCDLTRWENIVGLLADARPDIVLHLAGVVDNPAGQGNAAACFYENVMIGVQLMEAARQRGVQKMVCVGTAGSYPQHAPVPYREEDFWNGYPDPSRAAYAVAKKVLLTQAQAYRQQYGFDAIYLVPTNLFGPGDNFDPATSYVIPALVRRFLEAVRNGDREVVCWGSGKATRDFLYVDDCAEAILLATEFYDDPEPVNLGSGQEILIGELTQHIADLAGYSGRIVWDCARPDGPAARRLEVSRAERGFGFRAQTDFREGLRRTVDWYRGQLSWRPQNGRGEVNAQRI